MKPTPEQKKDALRGFNNIMDFLGEGTAWNILNLYADTIRACLTDTEETPEERAAWVEGMVTKK